MIRKLSIRAALVLLVLLPTAAVAEDDPAMQLMSLIMRCPAISADGKHVAIYSQDPGGEKDAKTSLVVFDPKGKVEQQISVVPPATDAAKASTAATKIVKLLEDGGYARMGLVKRTGGTNDGTKLSLQLESGDVVLAVERADRKLTITGTRAGKKLTPIKKKLPAKDGPCPSVDGYSIANTQAGYDAKTQLFAFSLMAEKGGEVCFAHDFVVPLR
jgi:hypothetical protein